MLSPFSSLSNLIPSAPLRALQPTPFALSALWLVASNGLAPFGPSGAGVDAISGVTGAAKAVVNLFSHSGWAVLYLGVVTTALCHWIQTLGQRKVGAEQVLEEEVHF